MYKINIKINLSLLFLIIRQYYYDSIKIQKGKKLVNTSGGGSHGASKPMVVWSSVPPTQDCRAKF